MTKQLVAIKVVNPALMQRSDEGLMAASSEYQILKEITGDLPSEITIPRALEIFNFKDYVFIVQEFIRGDSLAEHGLLNEGEALRLLRALLRAIHFVHGFGYIHRDIKPANVVRCEERDTFFLVDFGGARKVDRNTVTTYGCPVFAAPEQMSGRGVSSKADVYGVGATVIYSLTGLNPYDYMYGTAEDWNINRVVSPELEEILSSTIAGNWKLRPSAGELLEHITSILGEESPMPERVVPEAPSLQLLRNLLDAIGDHYAEKLLQKFGFQ